MAETEDNVNEAPETAGEAPVEEPEAGAEEAAAEEAPAEEPAAEEAAVEEAPAEEAPAEPHAAEPKPQLSPKERRARERSRHSGEALPPRSAEERAAARTELRRDKARRRSAYRARARERRGAAAPAAPQPAEEPRTGGRAKVRQGVVTSDRPNKTITVRVDIARQHRRYGKIVRTSSSLHVHDEANDAHVGDTVRVVESRPLSRTKRWRLVEVLERAR
jgi:small subunit ribosomal protein S17